MELKPCPFCQGTRIHTPSFDVQPDGIWQSHVECSNCEARGPNAYWYENDEGAENAAIAAWNAIPTQLAAPAGYKLVPIEPTPEMIEAAECDRTYYGSVAANYYRAMLAAAPGASHE